MFKKNKSLNCGAKFCEKEFKNYRELHKHQFTYHQELIETYACDIPGHCHVTYDARRKCRKRNGVSLNVKDLTKIASNEDY